MDYREIFDALKFRSSARAGSDDMNAALFCIEGLLFENDSLKRRIMFCPENFVAADLCVSAGRLRELAQADKEGRVVVLPCKIGDSVYFDTFAENATKRLGILPHEVAAVRSCVIVKGWPVSTDLPVQEYGKSWFLTREEAAAALERQKGERDG